MEFLNRNAGAIQAIGAILTVLLALAALIGVKVQIDATERIQMAQSARDIYREYLNQGISKPEFAKPDFCAISESPQLPAYENYVEYMLYTADQAIAADPSWQSTFEEAMGDHAQYLCSLDELEGYSDDVAELLKTFQARECAAAKPC